VLDIPDLVVEIADAVLDITDLVVEIARPRGLDVRTPSSG
jgi:hypothetical protein